MDGIYSVCPLVLGVTPGDGKQLLQMCCSVVASGGAWGKDHAMLKVNLGLQYAKICSGPLSYLPCLVFAKKSESISSLII